MTIKGRYGVHYAASEVYRFRRTGALTTVLFGYIAAYLSGSEDPGWLRVRQ